MDFKLIRRWTAGFAEACCVWVDFQGYICMQPHADLFD